MKCGVGEGSGNSASDNEPRPLSFGARPEAQVCTDAVSPILLVRDMGIATPPPRRSVTASTCQVTLQAGAPDLCELVEGPAMQGVGVNLLGQVFVWKCNRVSELAFGRCGSQTQSRALGRMLSSRVLLVISVLRGPAACVCVSGLRRSDFGKWLHHCRPQFTCLCGGDNSPFLSRCGGRGSSP